MNQIERTVGHNYHLRLWSNAVYKVDTSQIKKLLDLVAQQLRFDVEVDAYYYDAERKWRINFTWIEPGVSRRGFEHNADHSQIVCANAAFLEHLAFDLGDRIRRSIVSNDNQNWVIVRLREGFLAGIHQRGKTSVNLILREVRLAESFPNGRNQGRSGRFATPREAIPPHVLAQNRNNACDHTRVTIEAFNPGNVILRGDSVEVGGMLLQGELLEWLEIGEEGWFSFSPNTYHVNISSSPDERITFSCENSANTIRPRLAHFGRMLEQGQVEIPRSGYFDGILTGYPRQIGDRARIVMPHQIPRPEIRFIEPFGASLQELRGLLEVASEEIISPMPNAINAIGDRTCKYNALSTMLRCAVNPCGPCEGCQHYEKI